MWGGAVGFGGMGVRKGGSRSVYRGLTMGPSLAARNLWTPPQNASEKGGGGGDIPGRTNSGLGVPAPAVVFGDAGGDPWTYQPAEWDGRCVWEEGGRCLGPQADCPSGQEETARPAIGASSHAQREGKGRGRGGITNKPSFLGLAICWWTLD